MDQGMYYPSITNYGYYYIGNFLTSLCNCSHDLDFLISLFTLINELHFCHSWWCWVQFWDVCLAFELIFIGCSIPCGEYIAFGSNKSNVLPLWTMTIMARNWKASSSYTHFIILCYSWYVQSTCHVFFLCVFMCCLTMQNGHILEDSQKISKRDFVVYDVVVIVSSEMLS